MILSPTLIKTLLAGSLVISSFGIAVASGLSGRGLSEKDLEVTMDTELAKEVSTNTEVSISEVQTTGNVSQSSNQSNPFNPICKVFVVEEPVGYGSWGEVKGRLWTHKVKRHYEGDNHIYKMFKQTCIDFRNQGYRSRIYVYYNSVTKKGAYSDYLQGKDGLYDQTLPEVERFDSYSSFKQ